MQIDRRRREAEERGATSTEASKALLLLTPTLLF